MKFKINLIIIGAIAIMFLILSGCVNKSFLKEKLDYLDLTEISEYEIYLMPDHIRCATSRVVNVDGIIKENTYICEEDLYNYAIFKIKNEGKYLFVLFEKEDGRIISTIYTDKFYNEKDIIDIKIGTPLKKIYEKLNISMDSNIDLSDELYLYLVEGGYFTIKFDNKSNVSDIEKYNDQYGFMNLLKQSHDFDISQLYYE